MKPRTKIQHEVFEMNNRLLNVNDKIKTWAFIECNDKIGFATKTKFWCIDCGDEHSISHVQDNKAVCPTCNIELIITKSRKRKFDQSYWVAFAELSYGDIMGDVQVIRLFEVKSYHSIHRAPRVEVQENIRQFIPSDHDNVQYVARKRNMGSGYPIYGDLEIRIPSYYNDNAYNPYAYKYHPFSQFKPEYEKLGIDKDLQGLTFLGASRTVRYNSNAETLLKLKQYSLFSECYYNDYRIRMYWSSIKIAIRNGYQIGDAGMWLDYMDLLSFFRKDVRSPKYICPDDLKKEHDRYVAKKREVERKKRIEDQKAKLIKDEAEYKKSRGVFFGIKFSDGDLEIKVLESVKEFIEQGDVLHHCVYASEYYRRDNSLVMGAFKDGSPLETIEIDLQNMEIVQARGLHNKASEYNSKIKSIIQNNMHLIQDVRSKIAV